jgi:signal transduction histidine kinase
MTKKSIAWLVFLCAFTLALKAQDPYSIRLNTSNGLPSNTVYHNFAASSGHLYFATAEGLVRYDGARCEHLPFEHAKGTSVTNIQEDKLGRVWCHNFSNELFYTHSDSLKVLNLNDQTLEGNLLGYGLTPTELIVISTVGIGVFDLKTVRLKYITKLEDWSKNPNLLYLDAYISTNGKIVLRGDNQILIGDSKTVKERYPIIKKGDFELNELGGKLYLMPQQVSLDTIYHIDPKSGIIPIPLETAEPSLLYYHWGQMKPQPGLWLFSSKGIWYFENGQIKKRFFQPLDCTSMVQDIEGNYWISTLHEGVLGVSNLDISLLIPNEANWRVKSVAVDAQGMLYVGGRSALRCYDQQGVFVQDWTSDAPLELDRILYNEKQAEIRFNFGTILLAAKKYIIHDEAAKEREKLSDDIQINAHSQTTEILVKKGTVLPSKWPKLKSANFVQNEFEKYVIHNARTRFVRLQENTNLAWIGAADDLYTIDMETLYKRRLSTPTGASIAAVDLAWGKDGSVWVASITEGILVFKNNAVVKRYNTAEGLKSGHCRRILASDDGFWVLSNAGVDRISPDGQVFNYNAVLGVNPRSITDIAVYKGIIYLVVPEGLLKVNIQEARAQVKPLFRLKNVQINGQRSSLADLWQLRKSQSVRFVFDYVSYFSREAYQLEYKLDIAGHQWQTVPYQRAEIELPPLQPGRYNLEVRLHSKQDQSVINTFSYPLRVLTPWWQTWWLKLALILGSVSLLIGLLLRRQRNKEAELQRLSSEAQLQQQLTSSRLYALRSQMNPHFMYNALNSIQSFIFKNEKSNANDYLGRFSDMMRMMLDFSGRQYISLREEVEGLNLYLELEALNFDQDEFVYNIETPLSSWQDLQIPSMIVQPFVENAIKHGLMHQKGVKKLSISFEFIDERLIYIAIDDNGIGRKASQEINNKKPRKHSSFAMSAIHNRIDLLNKDLEHPIKLELIDKHDQWGMAKGTTVKLWIYLSGENTHS